MSERPRASHRTAIVDRALTVRIEELIAQHTTFSYRRLGMASWSIARPPSASSGSKAGSAMNAGTPRDHGYAGCGVVPKMSNERWAMDLTHAYWGKDGWAHLAAVIECHDREIVGYEFSLRGRAKEGERALEGACLSRLGRLRPEGETPVVRSDNGLIFQSRRFRAALRDYRLRQEFITPYTPEQNGMIERCFPSSKEECVWQHMFADSNEGRPAIRDWIRWYNEERPRQSLG